MVLQTFKRYEKKYSVDSDQAEKILNEIKKYMEPDPYCADGRYYTISNIYFDNDTNDIIRTSVAKPYFKEKLRLRSYGVEMGPDDTVFFEIKRKSGKIVYKRRAALTYREALDFIENRVYRQDCDYMCRQVLEEIGYFIDAYRVKPAVFISYDRLAFFGRDDPEFRVTFDSNIITRRDELYFTGERGEPLIGEDQRLMEIKISDAVPFWLARMLSDFKIYSINFSKYGSEYTARKTDYESDDQKSGRTLIGAGRINYI